TGCGSDPELLHSYFAGFRASPPPAFSRLAEPSIVEDRSPSSAANKSFGRSVAQSVHCEPASKRRERGNMANILILDDEQSSRTRLFEALSALDQHKLFTAANPIAWARCVEELAGAIHVLIMDSSFLAAPAPELLDLFRE